MSRKLNDYLVLGLKGIAMGAADVVPGVSGGTIAFISGIYEELLASGPPEAPDVEVSEEDLAFLMYTSGTTGRPKGAMLTHQNLVCNTINWVMEMEARSGDVWLSGLPLFHIGGVNGLLPFIYVAGTCIITPSTGFDPEESLRLLEQFQPDMCYFVPTQWQQICELPRASESRSIAPHSDTVTEGPWTETTEQLGGYYEVRTEDLDDLMDVCRILSATGDAVEVHRKITGEEAS